MCGKKDEKKAVPTDLKAFESMTSILVGVRGTLQAFVSNAQLIVTLKMPFKKMTENFPDLEIVEDILSPIDIILKPFDLPVMCPKAFGLRRRRRRLLMDETFVSPSPLVVVENIETNDNARGSLLQLQHSCLLC